MVGDPAGQFLRLPTVPPDVECFLPDVAQQCVHKHVPRQHADPLHDDAIALTEVVRSVGMRSGGDALPT